MGAFPARNHLPAEDGVVLHHAWFERVLLLDAGLLPSEERFRRHRAAEQQKEDRNRPKKYALSAADEVTSGWRVCWQLRRFAHGRLHPNQNIRSKLPRFRAGTQ